MFEPVFNPFSVFVDKTEKKTDKLLNRLAYKDKFYIQKDLLKLMQLNLVAVDLWLERKFKGYKYLTKGRRKKLYKNADRIVRKFYEFCISQKIDRKTILSYVEKLGFTPLEQEDNEKIIYFYQMMSFLKPGKYYEYLEGASFGKLLSNIDKEKMIGDCNQVVTFYTYLYSQKYSIRDLKIKLLPGHVCLHFKGIDIEATNGTFQKYDKYTHILPITELISTNLLDTVDFRDKTLRIDPRAFVKGAKLAVYISSMKEIVSNNLKIAYHNLVVDASMKHDYETAKFYLDKLQEPELSTSVLSNAAIYFTENKNYSKAKYYADLSQDRKIKDYVLNQEGWTYLQNGDYSTALKIFESIPNPEMIQACYAKQYNSIQKRVADLKTASQHRSHKYDYEKMLSLAQKMGNPELETNLRKFLDSINHA